ncbi:MAG: heme-binding protein [Idiomarina sp.]|nr:heme-binding protein [Idiomarina sp.]
MNKLSLISVLGIVLLGFAGMAMATEEPKYEVLEQKGDVELRLYEPMLVAETWVSGSMSDASGRGFRLIADFIFGNNTSATGVSEDIAMTTPVTMQAEAETISMTAPVTMEQYEGRWRVHFVMPSEYTYETLPKPNNPQVQIRQIPAKKYAVIRFSGFAGERKATEKTADLLVWMQENNLTPSGNPEVARYDPPWRLPFFRRNEVMIAYQ